MAKRFTDSEKWNDDWYLSLSNDYRIVWQWLLDNCNHAGVCKRSINILNRDCNTCISEAELLAIMQGRIVVSDTIWFIPKFLKFQYPNLRSNKPVIISVVKELYKYNLAAMIPESFGNDYIIIKDKDKDKDKNVSNEPIVSSIPDSSLPFHPLNSTLPPISPYLTIEENKRQALLDTSPNGFVETHFRSGIKQELLARWMEAFNKRLSYDGSGLKQAKDYRFHFANWLKFQDPLTHNPDNYSPVSDQSPKPAAQSFKKML